jgi:hypothetical protein
MDDQEAIRRAEAILRKHGETQTTIMIIRPPRPGERTQTAQRTCASLQAAIQWAKADSEPQSNVSILIHDPDGDVSETDQAVMEALLRS